MDIKRAQVMDVVKSGAKLEEERSQDVLVHVLVEVDAPDSLVDGVRERLQPETGRARVSVGVAGAGEPVVIGTGVDVLIVAAGSVGDEVRAALAAGREALVPTVLVALGAPNDRRDLAAAAGHPAADVLVDEDAVRLLDAGLAEWIADEVASKRIAFARNFAFLRRAVAWSAVRATAWQNGLIGTVGFVPGADMPVMTANQIKMLLQVAAAYGQPLGPERVKEVLAAIGGGLAFRTIARQIVGVVPVFGWAVKGGIGYSGTLAMGKAAIAYFEAGAHLPDVVDKSVSQARGAAGE